MTAKKCQNLNVFYNSLNRINLPKVKSRFNEKKKERDFFFVKFGSWSDETNDNVTVRARHRGTYWQPRKRERTPRVANRASDCRVLARIANYEGGAERDAASWSGRRKIYLPPLPYACAIYISDLPPPRRYFSGAASLAASPPPPHFRPDAARRFQTTSGLICRRSHRRTTRKRKNHPLALLVEA